MDLDKVAGLYTMVQNLKKRLHEFDTSKASPTEVSAVADALEKLEKRLEKYNEKKKQRMLEKENKEKQTQEVKVEAKPEELKECEICHKKYPKDMSACDRCHGDPKIYEIWKKEQEITPIADTKVEDDKVIMPKEEFVKEHEQLVDILEAPVEEAKEQKKELEEVKEAKAPFEVDSIVEPVKGTPGSEGRVMIYDPLHKLVYVKWDKGVLKEKHDFGGYNPKDLKVKEACVNSLALTREEEIRKQLDEQLKKYLAAPTMKEKEEHKQRIHELREELSKTISPRASTEWSELSTFEDALDFLILEVGYDINPSALGLGSVESWDVTDPDENFVATMTTDVLVNYAKDVSNKLKDVTFPGATAVEQTIEKLPVLDVQKKQEELLEQLAKETDPQTKQELIRQLKQLRFASIKDKLTKKAQIPPEIYDPLYEALEKGMSFEETQKYVNEKSKGKQISEEDYNEMKRIVQFIEKSFSGGGKFIRPKAQVEGPSGIGYGDRPGIVVAPKRDEDVSLNADKEKFKPKCPYCLQAFDTWELYNEHLKKDHASEKEAAWIDVANKKWWVEPSFDDVTKKYIYKVLDDQKKPLMDLKFDQVPAKEVIEKVIWEQLDKHAMLGMEAKKSPEVEGELCEGIDYSVGDKIQPTPQSILYSDKGIGEIVKIKYIKHFQKSYPIWVVKWPDGKFNVTVNEIIHMKKVDTPKKHEHEKMASLVEDLAILKKGHKVKILEIDKERKEVKFASLENESVMGWAPIEKFAWDMGVPAAIRRAIRAVQPHNYEIEEYDMVNGTFKKFEIPRKDTKMRMDDPTRSIYEIRDPYGSWALTTPDVFNKWYQMWKEENEKKFKKPVEEVVPVESEMEKDAYIEKTKDGYCVKSPKNPTWSGGCFKTHEEAKRRLGEIEMFKSMNAKKLSKRDSSIVPMKLSVLKNLELNCPDCYTKFLKFAKEKGIRVKLEAEQQTQPTIEEQVNKIRERMTTVKEKLQSQASLSGIGIHVDSTRAGEELQKANVSFHQDGKWLLISPKNLDKTLDVLSKAQIDILNTPPAGKEWDKMIYENGVIQTQASLQKEAGIDLFLGDQHLINMNWNTVGELSKILPEVGDKLDQYHRSGKELTPIEYEKMAKVIGAYLSTQTNVDMLKFLEELADIFWQVSSMGRNIKVAMRKVADAIPGGLADKKKPEDFDPVALEEGIKVEMEHTSDPAIAKEITMDHLTEDLEYYKKLKEVEIPKHPIEEPAVEELIKWVELDLDMIENTYRDKPEVIKHIEEIESDVEKLEQMLGLKDVEPIHELSEPEHKEEIIEEASVDTKANRPKPTQPAPRGMAWTYEGKTDSWFLTAVEGM